MLLVAPMIVWLGAGVECRATMRRICRSLGAISYGVYAIHYPLIGVVSAAAAYLGWRSPWLGVAFVGSVAVAAWVLDRA